MDAKIVFMGSPEFALPSLQSLAARFNIVGVVTQPDRPAGRGRSLSPPAVKTLAKALGLPVIQPEKLAETTALQQILAWVPDVIIVAAYGQILRPAVLDLPAYGCLNVHASLLPRWRGAAPVQAAILHGDTQSGVTIMRMDPGVDTGSILSQRSEPIRPDDTAGTLAQRLAELGAALLLDVLPGYLSGTAQPQPQDESLATYAPTLTKEDGLLDYSQPAEALARKVRAFNPWPGTHVLWQGQPFKILYAHAQPGSAMPGVKTDLQGLPALGTADGWLVLDEVQPAGKKAMPGEVFLRGAKAWGR